MNLHQKIVKSSFTIESEFDKNSQLEIKALYKKKAIESLAKHLLENGFICEHKPILSVCVDTLEYRFTFYALKPERILP